jgi:hypothetical protein
VVTLDITSCEIVYSGDSQSIVQIVPEVSDEYVAV